MTSTNTIQDAFVKCVAGYADHFAKDPEKLVATLCNTTVPTKICNDIYNILVSDGTMQRLEDLTTEEKEFFKPFITVLNNVSKERQLEVYRAVHTIDFISKNI